MIFVRICFYKSSETQKWLQRRILPCPLCETDQSKTMQTILICCDIMIGAVTGVLVGQSLLKLNKKTGMAKTSYVMSSISSAKKICIWIRNTGEISFFLTPSFNFLECSISFVTEAVLLFQKSLPRTCSILLNPLPVSSVPGEKGRELINTYLI